MPKFFQLLLTLLALALPHAAGAQAELPAIRLEITSRVAEDRMFGHHGPWERISGVAHMRIDPAAPANRGIADLALAPRGADGLVAYDIDFAIVRSRAVEHVRRRMLLYDVVNRGMSLHSMFAFDRQNKHDTEPVKTGEGFLLSQGYTLVRSGWQGDIARPGLLGARFPVASQNGQPVTGLVATETIFDNTSATSMTLPYAAASLDQPGARLTVRARADDAPVVIAPADWRFENDRKIVITRPANMDAGAIYRFEYTARDPWVMGLGFAATRDFISWLRHATAEQGNPLADLAAAYCERDAKGACANPEGGIFSTAVAFGASQSGRYLRDFVWQGFNRDLAGRRVFDGVIPFIPGARQTFTNFRFAEPGRFSRQHEDHDVPGFTFPFAYATLKDPVTGKSDGILKSCTATRTCPRIFHIDTSAEFWQAGSSLVGTGGTGRDVPFPADVRAYMIAGGAHAPGMMLPACRYPANSFNYTPIVRALVTAMIDWTVGRQAPPASQWPRLAKGELVAIESLRGPEVPALGLTWARVANQPIAPAGRPGWPVHVPAIDADGNDAGRHPAAANRRAGGHLSWLEPAQGRLWRGRSLLAGRFLPPVRQGCRQPRQRSARPAGRALSVSRLACRSLLAGHRQTAQGTPARRIRCPDVRPRGRARLAAQ